MIDIDPTWLTQLLTAVGVLITAIVGIINVALSKRANDRIDDTAIELKALKGERMKRVPPPPPPPQRSFKKV